MGHKYYRNNDGWHILLAIVSGNLSYDDFLNGDIHRCSMRKTSGVQASSNQVAETGKIMDCGTQFNGRVWCIYSKLVDLTGTNWLFGILAAMEVVAMFFDN